MKITLDAQDKKIGRIASQAASALLGKNAPSFAKNAVSPGQVEIINASRAYVTAKKKAGGTEDDYVRYTGHRGGLKSQTLGELIRRKGMSEAFRLAVYGMLPNNKLRAMRMKNLTVKE